MDLVTVLACLSLPLAIPLAIPGAANELRAWFKKSLRVFHLSTSETRVFH